MKTRRFLPVCLAGSVALAAVGCGRSRSSDERVTVDLRHNPSSQGTKVATFNDDSVTVEELNERLAQMTPQLRARYQTPDERKTLVDNLVRFELLAEEAAREGFATDKDVVANAKRLMVNKLLEKEAQKSVVPPSDGEIESFYHSHLTDFQRPEQVNLSLIFFAAPTSGPAKTRTQKKAEAQTVRAEAAALQSSDNAGFAKLVQAHSEDLRSKPLGGDTTLKPVPALAETYGTQVTDAAHALQKIGDLSPVVETDLGFYVLKLKGRTPELARKLEDAGVRQQIVSRLNYDRRNQAVEHFVQELKAKSHYQVNEALVASIKVDPSAPSTLAPRPGGPRMMNMMPSGMPPSHAPVLPSSPNFLQAPPSAQAAGHP